LFQATTPTGDRLFRVPSTGGADVSLGINRPPERFADWQRIVAQPGGGAGPGPAQPSAGLGGLAVTSASFRPRWRVSRLGGSLVLGGDVARPVLLEAVVVGAGAPSRALLSRRFRVTKAGRFKARVPIAGLLPGSYLLRVRDVGGATPKLAAIERPITLAAPREGVVARAWISTSIGGTPRRTIAKGPGILFANVRFAALPARGLPRRVTWYWSGMSRAIETTAFPRALRVTRFVRRGGPLPSGSYRAELTAGGRLIAVVRARIR
jgi:hypothetical protein